MIEVLRRNPGLATLALACGVLAVIVVVELLMPGSGPAPTSRKVAAFEAKLLPPVTATGAEQLYPETVNRPLWIPTRRPAPAPVLVPAAFAPGQFILQGVIVAGGTNIAMLKEKTSGRVHRVEKGREVNGIQVAEVEPEKVTLAQGDAREVIELRVTRPGAPGVPGAPPPPPVASSAGPFAGVAPARGTTPPGVPPGVPPTGAPPIPSAVAAPPPGSPFGAPPRPPPVPPTSAGPMPPGPANPATPQVPQQATTAPMTPEELLARRRARRNQTP
jgi:hypothetical protein